MTLVQRFVARLAARRARVNLLVVESTGVAWRIPVQTSRQQLQTAAARHLAK